MPILWSNFPRSAPDAPQPPHADASARRQVELVVSGDPADARRLEETVRELVARLRLEVVAPGVVDRSRVLARVLVDLAALTGARLVIVDGRDDAVVLERVLPRESTRAVEREQVAHAVRSAVESLLLAEEPAPATEGAAEPTPPLPASAPAPTPEPTSSETRNTVPAPAPVDQVAPAPRASSEHAAPPSAFAVDLATLAAAGPVANGAAVVPRVGGEATFGSRRAARPSIALSVLYALPFETSTQLLSAHTSLISARAVPGVEVVHAPRWALSLGLGAGVDVMTVDASSGVLPAAAVGPSTTRVDPVLRAAATARFALVPSVFLTVAAAADVSLVGRSYVLDDAGQRTDVFSPWRVRPVLIAGLAFTALGEASFAAGAP